MRKLSEILSIFPGNRQIDKNSKNSKKSLNKTCLFTSFVLYSLIGNTNRMKYFRQFFLILAISFAGEILHMVLPLPVPASIYGLVLMLLALVTGIVKIEQVKDTAVFLIEIMPVMFIPAAVGLLDSWSVLRPTIVPVIVITVLTTIIVMVVTGRVTQNVIRKGREKEENE